MVYADLKKKKLTYNSWYLKQPQEFKDNKREQRYRNRIKAYYKFSIEDYNKLLKEQNGKCKICGRTDPGRKGSVRLCVDHDHNTGIVRGLLCYRCNIAIGSFQDDVKILQEAIKYLNGKIRNEANPSEEEAQDDLDRVRYDLTE
jgi:Recombination endonuclease VII